MVLYSYVTRSYSQKNKRYRPCFARRTIILDKNCCGLVPVTYSWPTVNLYHSQRKLTSLYRLKNNECFLINEQLQSEKRQFCHFLARSVHRADTKTRYTCVQRQLSRKPTTIPTIQLRREPMKNWTYPTKWTNTKVTFVEMGASKINLHGRTTELDISVRQTVAKLGSTLFLLKGKGVQCKVRWPC